MLRFLNNQKIIVKILLPALLLAVISAASVIYGAVALNQVNAASQKIRLVNAKRLELALAAESVFNSAAVSEKNVILSSDEPTMHKHIGLYDKASEDTLALIERLAPLVQASDEKTLVDAFRTAVQARRGASAQVFELALNPAERTFLFAALDVDMNPLMVAGDIGELIDFFLGDVNRLAPRAELLADFRAERGNIVKLDRLHWGLLFLCVAILRF